LLSSSVFFIYGLVWVLDLEEGGGRRVNGEGGRKRERGEMGRGTYIFQLPNFPHDTFHLPIILAL
jgi:hypothetical protein